MSGDKWRLVKRVLMGWVEFLRDGDDSTGALNCGDEFVRGGNEWR